MLAILVLHNGLVLSVLLQTSCIRSIFALYVTRVVLVIAGVSLVVFSIPAYHLSPWYKSDVLHSFINSMTGGNMDTASMLRQMG